MLNKKGVEEEGTKFSMENIKFVILFIIILVVVFLLIIPKLSQSSIKDTLYNFMIELMKITGGE